MPVKKANANSFILERRFKQTNAIWGEVQQAGAIQERIMTRGNGVTIGTNPYWAVIFTSQVSALTGSGAMVFVCLFVFFLYNPGLQPLLREFAARIQSQMNRNLEDLKFWTFFLAGALMGTWHLNPLFLLCNDILCL